MVKRNEDTGQVYDSFRHRIMFPNDLKAECVFIILTSREKEGILSLLAFLYMIISVFLNQLKL